MNIAELFVSIGLNVDEKELKKFDKQLSKVRKNIFAAGTAFTGASIALNKLIESTAGNVINLENFNKQTGLSIDKLQKWQQAASLSNLNLSADEVLSTISSVQQELTNVQKGLSSGEGFMLAGIDINTDAFGLMDQLREKIKDLNESEAVNLIQKAGLSPEFINVLRLSQNEFDKLSEGSFLNQAQRKSIEATAVALKQVKIQLKQFKDIAIGNLAPELERIIKGFFEWLKRNGAGVINAMQSVVKIMSDFVLAIGNAFALVHDFIGGLVGVENATKTIVAGLALLVLAVSPFKTLALLLNPFTLGLIAIIALLDDIKVWMSGGESLIGKFLDYDTFAENIQKIIAIFENFKDIVFNIFDSVFEKISEFASTMSSAIGGKVKSFFGFGDKDNPKETIESINNPREEAINSILPSSTTNANTTNNNKDENEVNNTTNNNNINVNVSTMADAKETATMTVNAIKNAQANLSVNSY